MTAQDVRYRLNGLTDNFPKLREFVNPLLEVLNQPAGVMWWISELLKSTRTYYPREAVRINRVIMDIYNHYRKELER